MRAVLPMLLSVLVLSACESGGEPERQRSEPPRPSPAITRAELDAHLRALQEIADRAGGTRAAGTPGDEASAEYVAARLREAGWRVELQPVRFGSYEVERAELAVGGRALRRGRDFEVLSYAASGRARGRLVAAGDGCSADDYVAAGGGGIALVERGGCRFWDKARLAQERGFGAIVVTASRAGARGIGSGTLGAPGIRIPALLAAGEAVRARRTAEVSLDARSATQTTHNVLAHTPGGGGRRVVMAGGHLDSVPTGPGINDNGSGIAALIELAEAIGPEPPGARVRLGFWAAEELGLIGSRRYVGSLSRAERRRLAAYLNFDMVGSPNAVPELYEDGDAGLGRILERVTPGRELQGVDAAGSSDHAPFSDAGVPVNGLYTGATETAPGGSRRDPCYHLACDTAANVDRATLLRMARAATAAVERLSRRHR